MPEEAKNAPLTDDELETVVGGKSEGEPFAKGDGSPLSGPENDVGSTSC